MKLILEDSEKAQKWIELFKILKNLNSYTTICSQEEKLFIQIMDDSQVCLMNVSIEKEWFDEYVSCGETFSILSTVIVKIFHLYTAGCRLCLETNDEKLNIRFTYPDKSEKIFELNLIDIERDMLESQNIEGSVEFEIKTKVFDKYISEMILFGENMEFICVQENIYMKSYGDEGKYTLKLPHNTMDELIVEDDLQLKTKISLKYLSYITKGHAVFPQMSVKIQKGVPLQLDILEDNIEIRYYIAPKMSDEDDEDEDFSEYVETEGYEHLENKVL
jgi:proliferating cell nuclear antigen